MVDSIFESIEGRSRVIGYYVKVGNTFTSRDLVVPWATGISGSGVHSLDGVSVLNALFHRMYGIYGYLFMAMNSM